VRTQNASASPAAQDGAGHAGLEEGDRELHRTTASRLQRSPRPGDANGEPQTRLTLPNQTAISRSVNHGCAILQADLCRPSRRDGHDFCEITDCKKYPEKSLVVPQKSAAAATPPGQTPPGIAAAAPSALPHHRLQAGRQGLHPGP
jgi:hypothetical protein